jgi:hypothetical protein
MHVKLTYWLYLMELQGPQLRQGAHDAHVAACAGRRCSAFAVETVRSPGVAAAASLLLIESCMCMTPKNPMAIGRIFYNVLQKSQDMFLLVTTAVT